MSDHRVWLSEWRTPVDMAAYVTAVNDAMGSADFFRQGGVEFLRDAWLAAEFGRHRQSECVRLVAVREQWPDFEARAGGMIERVECAEADVPRRRRGDEYRQAAKQPTADQLAVADNPIENWITRAEQVRPHSLQWPLRRSKSTTVRVSVFSSISTSANTAPGRRKSRALWHLR